MRPFRSGTEDAAQAVTALYREHALGLTRADRAALAGLGHAQVDCGFHPARATPESDFSSHFCTRAEIPLARDLAEVLDTLKLP